MDCNAAFALRAYDAHSSLTSSHPFRGSLEITSRRVSLYLNKKINDIVFGYGFTVTESNGYIDIQTYSNIYLQCQKAYYNNTEIAKASSSSRRYKHSIAPLSEALDPHKLLALPVVQFEWNDDHPLQYEDMRGQTIPGIIAEDVEEIYPAATIHNLDTGEIESWDERRIIPGMLALIQEQDERIKKLEDANKELLTRLERLEKMLT